VQSESRREGARDFTFRAGYFGSSTKDASFFNFTLLMHCYLEVSPFRVLLYCSSLSRHFLALQLVGSFIVVLVRY